LPLKTRVGGQKLLVQRIVHSAIAVGVPHVPPGHQSVGMLECELTVHRDDAGRSVVAGELLHATSDTTMSADSPSQANESAFLVIFLAED
jgi:quercetin dioxygenase-like cupin family protein